MRILLFAFMLGWALPGIAQHATVAEGTHVNLRAGKTDNYRVIRVLAPGTAVDILESDTQYARVRTQEGDIGWLPTRLLVVEPMDMHPAATPAAPGVPMTPAADDAPVENAAAALSSSPEPTAPEQSDAGFVVPWNLFIVGALCFLVGAVVGIGAHEAYYRKRLNGLRI